SDFTTSRRYIPGTNVIETEFRTLTGTLRLTHCMPVYEEDYARRHLLPDREVLRVVECTSGEVKLNGIFAPAPKFGSVRARWTEKGQLGIRVEFLGGALWMRSDLQWQVRGDHAAC